MNACLDGLGHKKSLSCETTQATFQRGEPMRTWKIFSLGLFAALWAACGSGAIYVELECKDDSGCPSEQSCVHYRCVLDKTVTVTTCEKNDDCPGDDICEGGKCTRLQCKDDGDCSDGICEGNKCVAPKCDASNPCAEGACEGGRCETKCDAERKCPGDEVCSKGVCKPITCTPTCSRAQACVSAGDLENPAKGKCVDVVCDNVCDSVTERCVSANNPDNRLEGECRPQCTILSGSTPNLCNPMTGVVTDVGICVSIGIQGTPQDGTCEVVKCAATCKARTEVCMSAGKPNSPTEGRCMPTECNGGAGCAKTHACVTAYNLSNPILGTCQLVKCEAGGNSLCNAHTEACVFNSAATDPIVGKCTRVECDDCEMRTHACVVDPGATDPLEGQCLAVTCAPNCGGSQTCVLNNPVATNPRNGVCRDDCDMSEADVCPAAHACTSLKADDPDLGTCEPE